MTFIKIKSLILINLLFFSITNSYGCEKISNNLFFNKAIITGLGISIVGGLILYKNIEILNILWYKFFSPNEKNLYEAVKNNDLTTTQIILTHPTHPIN